MGDPRVKSIHEDAYRVMVELLRAERKATQLTQADLAARLGTDQSYVSKYERAERRLDLLELRAICAALDLEVTEFLLKFERELHRRGLEQA